jgi:hypothetical protein
MNGSNRPRFNARNLIIIAFVVMAVGVIGAAWVATLNDVTEEQPTLPTAPAQASVFCHIGSEKDDFLSNPEVQRILQEDYLIDVSFNNMGSIDQAQLSTSQLEDVDCLWPSNTTALDIFEQQHPNIDSSDSIIFNSPIVLYTWRGVIAGLEQEGLVEETDEGHYVADMQELTDLLVAQDRPTWNDLGVEELYNGFNIVTTDPTRSNSGNMFYGLFLNMLNGAQVATMDDLSTNFQTIDDYYQRQGLMQGSSGTLFDNFIVQGMGATPMMANYESLIVEFSVANQEQLDAISQTLRIIYPRPTVWSAHPLIALTPEGRRLMDALADPEIQQIAWEQHGFRTGLAGITNDPAVLDVAGIPAQVGAVINLPRAEAMQEMVNRLDGN